MHQHEQVTLTEEMTLEEIEAALEVVKQAESRDARRPLLMPSSLKRLSPQDWLILRSLLAALEQEKLESPLH